MKTNKSSTNGTTGVPAWWFTRNIIAAMLCLAATITIPALTRPDASNKNFASQNVLADAGR